MLVDERDLYLLELDAVFSMAFNTPKIYDRVRKSTKRGAFLAPH